MKTIQILLTIVAFASLSFFVSCETVDKTPQPESPNVSSMPHNIPQSWEGQAGLPGVLGQAAY